MDELAAGGSAGMGKTTLRGLRANDWTVRVLLGGGGGLLGVDEGATGWGSGCGDYRPAVWSFREHHAEIGWA